MVSPAFSTISLGTFEQGDERTRRQVAADVDRICRDTGFVAIADHGVPDTLLKEVWHISRAFFDLPMEEKLAVRPPVGDPYGYFPTASESLARSLGDARPPDLKESFNIGPMKRPPGLSDSDAAAFCYSRNYWPDRPAGFESAWRRYYARMDDLAGRIMRLFAHALALSPGYFDDKIDYAISAMRAG